MANENINLATFSFDETKLIDSITKTKQAFLQLKLQQQDNNKIISEYQKSINSQIASQDNLKKSGLENSDVYKKNDADLKILVASQSNIIKANTELGLKINGVSSELRLQETVLKGTATTVAGTATPYANLNSELNKLKLESKNLGAEMLILERAGQKNTAEYKNLETQYKAVTATAKELDASFKAVDKAVGDTQRSVGDYKDQIKEAFSEMNLFNGGISGFVARSQEAGGAGNLLKNSFSGIKDGIMGIGKYLLTNPFGILLTVFAGISAGISEVYQYNIAIKESAILTEQLTGKTGKVADAIRNNATAFTETFGGEFKENLRTADELVNDFGITYDEAFKIMTDATIRGANANGEFGESINEYGVFFKKAGFSAQEFSNVIGAGVDLGVYSDKLPDAIKEIDLSLREQTKATKEALVGAFGATFTNDILTRVNSGATTTKQALAEISTEAEKSNLNQVQLATLTADVARGAGEDVGGIAVVFKAMNQAINSNKKPLTDLQKSVLEVATANKELQNAKDNALKSQSVVALGQEFSNFGRNAKIGFYNALGGLKDFTFGFLQGLTDVINKTLYGTVEVAKIIPNIFKQVFIGIKKTFNDLVDNFVLGGSIITKSLSGDFDGAKESFEKFKNGFSKIGTEIKSSASNIAVQVSKTVSDSNKEVQKLIDAKQKKLVAQSEFEAELANKKIETKIENKGKSPEQIKAEEDAKKQAIKDAKEKLKQAEENAKKEAEAQITTAKELANTQIETAKLALTSYIQDNQSKLTDAKRLTEALINEEKKRLEAVYQRNQDIIVNETIAKQKQLDIEINALKNKQGVLTESEKTHLADLQQQKTNNIKDGEIKEKELLVNHKKSLNEIDKNFETQTSEEKKTKRAQEFQLLLTEMETNGATEEQIKLIQLDREKEIELQKLKEKEDAKFLQNVEQRLAQDELITEEQAIKDELNLQLQTTKDESEKARIQNQLDAINILETANAQKKKAIDDAVLETKLQAYSKVFGDIGALFGKETAVAKIAGVAQAGINTYLGATQALKDPKLVAAYPLNIISAGTIIASGLQSVAKIQGFATGGIITDGQPISRRNGDDVLITAKRGEVILNQTQQAMLGGATTFSSIGVPGFATGGVVGSNIASVQNSITNSLDMSMLAETIGKAVFDGANNGTANGSQKGIIGLSENRQIANNANF
jgi:hypothetical protein